MSNSKRQSRLSSLMRSTFEDAPVVAPTTPHVLIDGMYYWLGAMWAQYNKSQRTFTLSNTFIRECDTWFGTHAHGWEESISSSVSTLEREQIPNNVSVHANVHDGQSVHATL